MIITNETSQDYWFGPLHLVGGVGQTLTVDDTSETSLYLIDDSVADAINNLYDIGNITVSGAADPFPRPTGQPEILNGDGSPDGLQFAAQGSLYLRRDGGDTQHLYLKTTAATDATGWLAVPGQKFDTAAITSDTSGITATTEGTAETVIQGNAVWYDGSQVRVSFMLPKLSSSAALDVTFVVLRDTDIVGQIFGGTVDTTREAFEASILDNLPGAGVYQYSVAAFVSAGTFTGNSGSGGSGQLVPGWLRVQKA